MCSIVRMTRPCGSTGSNIDLGRPKSGAPIYYFLLEFSVLMSLHFIGFPTNARRRTYQILVLELFTTFTVH